MIVFFRILLFIIILPGIVSCVNENRESKRKSTGKTAELIVIINDSHYPGGVIRNEIDTFFSQEYQILPQPEPIFKLVHLSKREFIDNPLFNTHHNLLFAEINSNITHTSIDFNRDSLSAPQFICTILAPNDSSFVSFFKKNSLQILAWFNKSERTRIQKQHKQAISPSISKELYKKFGIRLQVPAGFFIAKTVNNFVWLRNETQKTSTGLMVYYRNYTDSARVNLNSIINYRNTLTKEYIPGPTNGSYMAVVDSLLLPQLKNTKINGYSATEVRGLWKVKGDFMGGTFLNYTIVDVVKKRIISLDGYVYAPNADKRDIMIKLDAIMNTVKLK